MILQLRPMTSPRRTPTTWTRPTTTPRSCTMEGNDQPGLMASSSFRWRYGSEFGQDLLILLLLSYQIPPGRISPPALKKKPSRPSRTPQWRSARGTTCPITTFWGSTGCTPVVSAGGLEHHWVCSCVAVLTFCLSVFCFRCLKRKRRMFLEFKIETVILMTTEQNQMSHLVEQLKMLKKSI